MRTVEGVVVSVRRGTRRPDGRRDRVVRVDQENGEGVAVVRVPVSGHWWPRRGAWVSFQVVEVTGGALWALDGVWMDRAAA